MQSWLLVFRWHEATEWNFCVAEQCPVPKYKRLFGLNGKAKKKGRP